MSQLRVIVGRFFNFPRVWSAYDAPFRVKLRLYARNNWIKIRTLSLCCGNHGEPGC